MKLQNPDWYKLTKLLKTQKKISTGLTIPYIFGAYKLLEKPFVDIPDLLNKLIESNIDKYPVIQKCPEIQQHVIATESKNIYHKPQLKDVNLQNGQNRIGLVISSNTDLGKTKDLIFKNLIRFYKAPINSEKFSWNSKSQTWISFNQEEIKTILSIKK